MRWRSWSAWSRAALPERLIQIVAAGLFLAFGAYMLIEGLFPAASSLVVAAGAIGAVAAFAAVLWAAGADFGRRYCDPSRRGGGEPD
jgi:putative Ca2+/H+ antiporter (TMEM165/GDT1 family)